MHAGGFSPQKLLQAEQPLPETVEAETHPREEKKLRQPLRAPGTNSLRIFNDKLADEVIIFDIEASMVQRPPNFDLLEDLASECFMPVCYGGGVRSLGDMERLFTIGIEKVAVNTAATQRLSLIEDAAARFGSQSVVVCIDAKFEKGRYRVVSRAAEVTTDWEPAEYAKRLQDAGAGELTIQSVDRDGTKFGYDLNLVRAVTDAVSVPVIAVGGAGTARDLATVVIRGGAAAAAAGSLFVFHGRHDAVLVNMPTEEVLDAAWAAVEDDKQWERHLHAKASDEPRATASHERAVSNARRVCTFCVMDNSDADIEFDHSTGECNYCRVARAKLDKELLYRRQGRKPLHEIVDRMKRDGRPTQPEPGPCSDRGWSVSTPLWGKGRSAGRNTHPVFQPGREYDCVLGLSGGVDSSYAALRAVELGLRPLAVHLDNGWNDELAVSNIEKLLEKLNLDLTTIVVDWEEIKDLQRAFFRASVANIEVITDHAIFATLYRECEQRTIRYIVNGSNQATECISTRAFGYDARDSRAVSNIEKLLEKLNLDLTTIVVDWEEIKDLQRAFFRASVANIEVITDHAIFATLYRECEQRTIRYIVNGSNQATECISTRAFGYDARDSRHILGVHRRFGDHSPPIEAWQFA